MCVCVCVCMRVHVCVVRVRVRVCVCVNVCVYSWARLERSLCIIDFKPIAYSPYRIFNDVPALFVQLIQENILFLISSFFSQTESKELCHKHVEI